MRKKKADKSAATVIKTADNGKGKDMLREDGGSLEGSLKTGLDLQRKTGLEGPKEAHPKDRLNPAQESKSFGPSKVLNRIFFFNLIIKEN